MENPTNDVARPLSRREISDAITGLGWRFVLGVARTSVRVRSMPEALEVAARAVDAAGPDADDHLRVDVRRDRVILTLQTSTTASITPLDIDLAERISAVVDELELRTDPDVGVGATRSLQMLEIAIDAIDIASIRPFWAAALGYVDEPGRSGPEDPIVDPHGQGPAVWFQQMDAPRPQRNRIHLDISVPHDEAAHRIDAAIAAGGTLLSDAYAPAFWVLADAEGNEACITTWQGRDER
jgi:4a-hydroxytetrahydrobiopterin dehydratase